MQASAAKSSVRFLLGDQAMRLWVDTDNAPHVHVLGPIILELERRGHQLEVMARDY
jgi:hypothetical protein